MPRPSKRKKHLDIARELSVAKRKLDTSKTSEEMTKDISVSSEIFSIAYHETSTKRASHYHGTSQRTRRRKKILNKAAAIANNNTMLNYLERGDQVTVSEPRADNTYKYSCQDLESLVARLNECAQSFRNKATSNQLATNSGVENSYDYLKIVCLRNYFAHMLAGCGKMESSELTAKEVLGFLNGGSPKHMGRCIRLWGK